MLSPVANLHECKTVEQLYVFLNCNKNIGVFLYSDRIKYRSFSILKKNGKYRNIVAPVNRLKSIQQRVKVELEKYYAPKNCVHGFISGKNIVTNARPHIKKEFVLNIDLENFFGSINFGRVSRLFQSSPLNLPKNVASVLAHICCYKNELPQGGPASPIISNMIAFRLDRQLKELAKDNSCSYTRYADDITFSFTKRKKYLPKSILFFDREDNLVLGNELRKIIEENWFKLNEDKSRIQHRTQRQSVTNITVNSKINVSRKFKKQTSAMVNALLKYGAVQAEREYFDKYHKGYIADRQLKKIHENPGLLFTQKVRGRLNYIRLVCGQTNTMWRNLMYKYTEAIGFPNDVYKRPWWSIAEESTYIINNISKDNGFQGSGFLLENIGLITNEHVIEGINKENINDYLLLEWLPKPNKTHIDLSLAWKDKVTDLAVITSDIAFNGITHLEPELTPNYDVGTVVYAIGYPAYEARGSCGSATTIEARITGKTYRENQERIVIDKQIVHGHSGGVVLNTDARVIGVVANGNADGQLSVTPNAFIPIVVLLDEHNKRNERIIVI